MYLTDLIPINQISEIFDIPEFYRWLILFIILLIGYISLKYFHKFHELEKKITTIDETFLIAIFGSIFLFKSIYIGLWLYIAYISITISNNLLFLIPLFIIVIFVFTSSVMGLIIDIISIKDTNELQKNRKLVLFCLSTMISPVYIISLFLSEHVNYSSIVISSFLTFCAFITINPVIYYITRWYKQMI